MRRRPIIALAVFVILSITSSAALAVEDVMLQTTDGRVVTGLIDDESGIGELGVRVFRGNFLSNYRSANPGFFSLTSVNPNLPDGASGFPSQHDVRFDLVPMRVGSLSSNLLYWDGSDANGNGLDLDDVLWAMPANVEWQVVDGNSATMIAAGTDQIVNGGLIQRTSSDTNPGDGIDTGLLHKHLALLLNHTAGGTPPPGVYAIAWRAYSDTFAPSDPFVFVHRTSTIGNPVRDLAAQWIEEHLDTLFPSGVPGDYNDDGVVNASDYTLWRDALGSSIALPNEDASPNVVDVADYDVWKANFGASAAAGSGAIATAAPEPASMALLVIAASCFRLFRNRRGPRALATDRGLESIPRPR